MLLASAPTQNALLASIRKFYCGTDIEITESGLIRRLSDGKILKSVHVVKKGKQYQFRARA